MALRTLNPKYKDVGKGRRRCWGCKLHEINQWCYYRYWPEESRSGFAFRVFSKLHLLPTCRRDNFDYAERNEFVKKYCDVLGVDASELLTGTGRGGGGRKREEMVEL